MDRRAVGTGLVVAASLLAATAVSALVVGLTRPELGSREEELPYGIELPHPPVIASTDRMVSKTVLATADVAVSASAPGIALERVHLSSVWEESRAEIRDLTTGDVRSYAIGDLIPHGSLLVGVSTRSADIMVADVELVRLEVGAPPQIVEDFRTADEAQALKSAPDLAKSFRAALESSVSTLGTAEREMVQWHIDELVECGDPAVEVLIAHVDDGAEIAPGPYRVGNGGIIEPRVVGDVVIAVLESITGQTFGDPTSASDEERQELSRAWMRWWGIE